MSTVGIDLVGDDTAYVTSGPAGVDLEVYEIWGAKPGVAEVTLSPEQAVQLSRALVKAAAEALGVKKEES